MIEAMAYEKPKTIRRDASAATKRRIREEQGDRCVFRDAHGVQCTMPIEIWEHGWHGGVAVAIGNEGEPDAGTCKGHAYLKTVNEDNPRSHKADRQGGRTGPQARRERARAAGKPPSMPSRPFPTGHRPLPSRPFPKRRKDDV